MEEQTQPKPPAAVPQNQNFTQSNVQTPQSPESEKEEKLQFLKREEIRTMEKDVAGLRQKEALSERERISQINPEGQAKTQELSKEEESAQKIKESLIPAQNVNAPSSVQKIVVRAVVGGVVVLGLGAAGFFAYSYLTKEKGVVVNAPIEKEENPTANERRKEELVIPQAPENLLPIGQTVEITYATKADLPAALSQFISTASAEGFVRVLLKDSDGKYLAFEELPDLGISVPDNLFAGEYSLLSYNTQEKKRLGMVASLKQPSALSSWETTLEKDTQVLLSLSGTKDSAYTKLFRTTAYKGKSIRFQTFSRQDLGIVYTTVDNMFIMTSSLESMKALIDAYEQRTIEGQTP